MATVNVTSFSRKLPVTLADDELRARGDSLASLQRERTQIEEEKKTVLAEFRGRMKRIAKEATDTADQIATKTEYRDVECHEEAQPGKRIVAVIRKDTGEVVETRPMRDEERQEKLKLVDLPTESRSKRGGRKAQAEQAVSEEMSDPSDG